MFDQRIARLNQRIKRYDNELYAKRSFNNIVCVYRRNYRYTKVYEEGTVRLYDLIQSPQFVFALTDNWKTNGVPRDWGSEVVLNRLKQMDFWSDEKMLDKMEQQNEKVREAKERDFKNQNESFLIEHKKQFQKAFSEINTSTLSKRETRKIKNDLKKGF